MIRLQSKRYLDYFAVSYFLIVGAMMCMSVFYSMPYVYQESMDTLRNRQFLSLFLLLEVMTNYFLVMRNRSYYQPQEMLRTTQINKGWTGKTCPTCVHFLPPRTHHCPLCERCILKRDHHCFFTGTCVGFHNQRYFVVYCFYCTIASVYAMYINCYYLMLMYSTPDNSLWNYFPPITILKWMFGYVTSDFLYHTILTYICGITIFGSGGIFIWQFTLVVLGCTTYELWRTKGIYRKCSFRNFKSVFGPCWWLNFILPLPCLKQPGNGTDWGDPKHI